MRDEELDRVLDTVAEGTVASALESDTLDFKAVSGPDKRTFKILAEAAACFANATGGTVVVGMADAEAGPAAFVGCGLDVAETRRRIYLNTEPHLTVSVDERERQGRRMLVIEVPVSPEVHAVEGRCAERVGTSCQTMPPQRIATVVADRRGDDWSAEDTGRSLDDVEPLAVSVARRMLQRASDPAARRYATQGDQDLLGRLGAVTPDGTLTRAGALLFCSDPEAREQLVYIHRRAPSGALEANEHLSAPLLESIQRIFDMVDVRVDRTSVNLSGGQQLQLADLPEVAVREAIINGVMHRDYRRRGTIQVEHSATQLRVTSPGPFVSGVSARNVLTTPSRSRNPVLANAIRTLGLAETAGSGVDSMYVEMARIGHRPPSFSDDADHVEVLLLGGAPNAAITRFTATLPPAEARDADTMIVLLALLNSKTVTVDEMAPMLQRDSGATHGVLERLAAPPVELIEPTRETARYTHPTYRLREHVVAALGHALAYHRRSADEYDRKIIGMVRETDEINARMVRLMLDLDTPATSRVLSDLVDRGILVKTSKAQRGPSVTYGPGPKFPGSTKRSRRDRKRSDDQPQLLDEEDA